MSLDAAASWTHPVDSSADYAKLMQRTGIVQFSCEDSLMTVQVGMLAETLAKAKVTCSLCWAF